ncbi:outer membrane protein [Aquirufa aurantiipilula]|uniref:outer membrane protein n=1 Tax=Aquirufa aurantiipilula TaxID=2696561 RepID=UPI001CAA52E4|nr:outer membrane beta-barrel protein [Aquirufa aurantiipilula]MBZ1327614.1 porin family protein [Aquirufa aurantiipilula]
MITLSLPTTKKSKIQTTSKIIAWLFAISFSYVGFAQETNQLYKHAIGYKYTTLCQGITFRMKIDQSDQVEAFAGPIENDPNKRTTVLGVRYLHTFLQEKDFPINPYIFAGFGYAYSEIKHIGCKMKDPTDLFNLMGYSAGIGMELKVTDRISLNGEAARMTLFNTNVKGPNLDGISLNFGVNYSFGGIF